jgi:hypothetical protein
VGTQEIIGRKIDLPDRRQVFLGSDDNERGIHFIAFRNDAGVVTRLKISSEALTALIRLATNEDAGLPFCEPPRDVSDKEHWVFVYKAEDNRP